MMRGSAAEKKEALELSVIIMTRGIPVDVVGDSERGESVDVSISSSSEGVVVTVWNEKLGGKQGRDEFRFMSQAT